jgi:hypothetical protein
MALAATADLADGAYPDESQEVGVAPTREQRQADAALVRTVGWAAAVLAAVAVVGLVAARSLLLLWIVLLVLAIAAVPQALGIVRRQRVEERERQER